MCNHKIKTSFNLAHAFGISRLKKGFIIVHLYSQKAVYDMMLEMNIIIEGVHDDVAPE